MTETPDSNTFDMDGSEHYAPSRETGCCENSGKECEFCYGWCHYQPVYGGYYYECEDCHEVTV